MSRHIVKMKHPASWHKEMWREAMMLGNGLTGMLVHGAIAEETVQFNRYDLWHNGNDGGEIPDISDVFRGMREEIARGNYLNANHNQMAEALKERGYCAEPECPHPLGKLHIRYQPHAAFTDYERGIDLSRAEGYVQFRIGGERFERRMFVSRDRDVAVLSFRAEEPFAAQFFFELFRENHAEEPQCSITEEGIFCRALDGAYGVRIYFAGDCMLMPQADRLVVTGKAYRVIVQAYSHAQPENISDILHIPYEELLEKHVRRYAPLYSAVSVELAADEEHDRTNESLLAEAYDGSASPALIEKLWRFGRYLFISATAENGYPVPLYGLWHGEDNLPWCQYVENENVQMTYWHALAGGLSALYRPLIRYYVDKTDSFRACARKLFGMNGIWLPAYTTPGVSGASVPVGVIINWISGGGWLSRVFWDYYRYSGDEALLREEILPFMREVAQFYLDYVTYDEDGSMQIIPSVSPENTPKNFIPDNFHENMGHICPAVRNATMDFAVMKELLTNLLDGMRITGLYAQEKQDYESLLARIPGYRINEDGAAAEWIAEDLRDHYNHRHLSHLYPVFPGDEIHARNQPELFAAFEKAVQLRELGGQCGWSLTHMASIYARLGQSESVVEMLDLMAKSVVNNALILASNDWRGMGMTMDLGDFAPVQLDASFGAVNAVQEMLFRFSNGQLSLLPACPARFGSGAVKGIVFPYGSADIAWDETAVRVTIHAQKDFEANVLVKQQLLEHRRFAAGECFELVHRL